MRNPESTISRTEISDIIPDDSIHGAVVGHGDHAELLAEDFDSIMKLADIWLAYKSFLLHTEAPGEKIAEVNKLFDTLGNAMLDGQEGYRDKKESLIVPVSSESLAINGLKCGLKYLPKKIEAIDSNMNPAEWRFLYDKQNTYNISILPKQVDMENLYRPNKSS